MQVTVLLKSHTSDIPSDRLILKDRGTGMGGETERSGSVNKDRVLPLDWDKDEGPRGDRCLR